MAFKLLLADDSITIQKVVSLTFAEEDFNVTCVGNGEIAVEKICELHPDIVLADIFMPRKTGYEVCDFVKKTEPYQNTPVILLVGTFEPFDKEEAANVGADGFLTKPFETTALIKMVRQALEKSKAPKPAPSLDQTIVVDTSLRESPLHLISSRPPEGLKTVQIQQENLLGIGDTRARHIAQTDLDETVIPTVDSARSILQPDEILLEGEAAAAREKAALAEEEYLLPEPEVAVTPTVIVEEFPVPVPDFTVPPPSPFVEPPPAVAEETVAAEEAPMVEEGREEEEFPLEVPSPLETFVNVAAPVADEQDDVLEIQAFEKHVTLPSDEDILGIFDLIGIEDIIARQRTLEESVAASLQAPPAEEEEAMEEAAEAPLEAVAVGTLEPVPEEEAAVGLPEEVAAPAVVEAATAKAEPLLDETLVTRIARLVVERLSEKIIRDIAWEVVPDLADLLIRKELDNLKSQGKL